MSLRLHQGLIRLHSMQGAKGILGTAQAVAFRYSTGSVNGANQQQDHSKDKEPFWKSFSIRQFAIGCLTVVGSISGTLIYMRDQSKYSEKIKYNVVKNAMLQPIPTEAINYPVLCAKEQDDMMRDLVFGGDASLVLIEGAQGSGKTTLAKKLLNERITQSHVPCYYWSLKTADDFDFRSRFLERFGIQAAADKGIIPKDSIGTDSLMDIFRRLKKEHGAPCVLVIDDAQRLLLSEQGKSLALLLQEFYCERTMTVILIGSDGSSIDGFKQLSGYRARLIYRSLPPIPDEAIKGYLMGPMNDYLKMFEETKLFSEEMAGRVVSQFGDNFADLERFVSEVLRKKTLNEDTFLAQSIGNYKARFEAIYENADARVILDDLLKVDGFGLNNPYKATVLNDLARKNILSRHADKYTWNKRVVRTAYEKFVQEHKKPWYRFFYS